MTTGAASGGLTWGDVWPVASVALALIFGLVGTIYKLQQDAIAELKAQGQRLENELDTFRKVEMKALEGAVGALKDQVLSALTDLKVDLARHYVPKAELTQVVAQLREEARHKP